MTDQIGGNLITTSLFHSKVSERIADYATAAEDLKIIVLDLLPVENGFDHHTIKFDAVRNGSLVVRRGQTFDILVKFNREFVMQKDSLRFTFETGKLWLDG